MKNVLNNIAAVANQPYKTADAVNHENFPAWEMSNKEILNQLAMTGTLGNSFYASSKEAVEGAVDVLEKGVAQDIHDSIIKGRNEGFIRSFNILGLVYLSQKDPNLFKSAFERVILTGNDLEDFINITNKIRGFGRAIKTAIHSWLKAKTTPYYALKYKKQLADAIRISRFPGEDSIYKFIMKKYNHKIELGDVYEKYPQLKAYKDASEAAEKNEWNIVSDKIVNFKLDIDSIVGIKTPPDNVWDALAKVMPTMQFLKYLNKLDSCGVFNRNPGLVEKKLTVENLKKAKVFPFRLYTAYENVKNQEVCNHLAQVLNDYIDAFDWGVFNKYSWVIAPDVSGSMKQEVKGSTLIPSIVAGMFCGFFYKGLKKATVIPWDTQAHKYKVPKVDSVITHIAHIKNAGGGGTHMEIALQAMICNNLNTDVVLMITDSMEWGEGWLKTWIEYRKKVNSKAKAILLRVDSYNTRPFDDKKARELGIYQIFGWNDNVLKFIEFHLAK